MANEPMTAPELGVTKSTIMLSMTDNIRAALSKAVDSCKMQPATMTAITLLINDSPQRLPYQLLEDMCKEQFGPEYRQHLSLLLADTKWFFAEGEALKPRDRSTESIVEQIRRDAAQRAYQRITLNVDSGVGSTKGEWSSVGRDMRQMSSELTAVFNFLITVAAGFLFGYMGSDLLRPKRDLFLNVLAGIVLAVIVGGADLYFLIRHMARNDAAPVSRHSTNHTPSGVRPPIVGSKATDRKPSMHLASSRQLLTEKYKTQAAKRSDLLETKKDQ